MVVAWNGWNILFFRVMSEVRTRFKPSAVVCQCGVDTLAGDPMASFNLTQQSIGECVKYLMNWNLPLLLLGGGKLWAINPNTQQGSSLSVLDKQLSHFACLPGPFLACCHCRFSYKGDLLRHLRSSEASELQTLLINFCPARKSDQFRFLGNCLPTPSLNQL